MSGAKFLSVSEQHGSVQGGFDAFFSLLGRLREALFLQVRPKPDRKPRFVEQQVPSVEVVHRSHAAFENSTQLDGWKDNS